MKLDSLDQRLTVLEARQPDVDRQETRAFLAKLTEVELNTLHDIAERREVQGIEPTPEEQSYCNALRLKYSKVR
jgi:hypothetical protein